MALPASTGIRAQIGEAMKEMAVTARKAMEKSESCGPLWPNRKIVRVRTADEMQMPKDSVNCWNVE